MRSIGWRALQLLHRVVRSPNMRRVLSLTSLLMLVACSEHPVGLTPDLGARVSSWIPDAAAVLAYEDITGSGYTRHHVARDSATFAAIWYEAFGWMNQPQPPVDFTAHMIILAVSVGAAGEQVRVDSVVTYSSGVRGFVSTCSLPLPLAVEGHPGFLVRAPRNEGMYFNTRRVSPCWPVS